MKKSSLKPLYLLAVIVNGVSSLHAASYFFKDDPGFTVTGLHCTDELVGDNKMCYTGSGHCFQIKFDDNCYKPEYNYASDVFKRYS